MFASLDKLDKKIVWAVENFAQFQPRKWVMENMTCHHASEVLAESIAAQCKERGEPFSGSLYPKISGLGGMRYFDPEVRGVLNDDYGYLLSCVK